MKLAWVQTGTSTTLVSAEQLRTAVGSEQWNPSPDDIKTLKSGIKSFHDYLVEDEVGPSAPDQPIDDIINTETIEQRLGLTTLTPTIPALSSLPPLAPATPTLQARATTSNTQGPTIQLNLQHSSTYRQTNIYQRFGAPPTPRQLTPLRQPTQPHQHYDHQGAHDPSTPTRRLADKAASSSSAFQSLEQQVGEDRPPGSVQPEPSVRQQAPTTPAERLQATTPDQSQPRDVLPH